MGATGGHGLSVGSGLVHMEDADSPRPVVVSDPVQAEFLTDPIRKRFYTPFPARERRVAEAAAEVGCSLNTTLYRVRTMLDYGPLTVAREEPSAGRATGSGTPRRKP